MVKVILELWVDEEGKPIKDETRKCDVHSIHCVATEQLFGLFHGVLNIELGPIAEDGSFDLGALRFTSGVKEVSETFIILKYTAR